MSIIEHISSRLKKLEELNETAQVMHSWGHRYYNEHKRYKSDLMRELRQSEVIWELYSLAKGKEK